MSRRVVLSIVALGATAAVVVAVALSSGGVSEGTALGVGAEVGYSFGPMPPGQGVVVTLVGLENVTDEPITIRRISVIRRGNPEVARLVSIELSPEIDGGRAQQGGAVIYPPRRNPSGPDCTLAELVDPVGFVLGPDLAPDEHPLMVTRLEAVGPGRTDIVVGRVLYEQDGDLKRQDLSLTVEFDIRGGAKPKPLLNDRVCAKEAEVLSEGRPR